MLRQRSKHELRCFCARKPLLAVYGLDHRGRVYIHIKVFKQGRVFAETVVRSGEVTLLCRDCFRWHNIVIVMESKRAELRETNPPEELEDHMAVPETSYTERSVA